MPRIDDNHLAYRKTGPHHCLPLLPNHFRTRTLLLIRFRTHCHLLRKNPFHPYFGRSRSVLLPLYLPYPVLRYPHLHRSGLRCSRLHCPDLRCSRHRCLKVFRKARPAGLYFQYRKHHHSHPALRNPFRFPVHHPIQCHPLFRCPYPPLSLPRYQEEFLPLLNLLSAPSLPSHPALPHKQ